MWALIDLIYNEVKEKVDVRLNVFFSDLLFDEFYIFWIHFWVNNISITFNLNNLFVWLIIKS